MSIAVPEQVEGLARGRSRDLPPGHRFRMYFGGWHPSFPRRDDQETEKVFDAPIPPGTRKLLDGLVRRQRRLAGPESARWEIELEAPLAAGLGSEHPTENGFAFLDPYGLPVLRGSSIKGTIRRSAELLPAWRSDSGWTPARGWWLFGFDGTSSVLDTRRAPGEERAAFERWARQPDELDRELLRRLVREALDLEPDRKRRWLRDLPGFLTAPDGLGDPSVRRAIHLSGALAFEDALPAPPRGEAKLCADIMNPHHIRYYRDGRGSPLDCEDPTPIRFLVVPEGWSMQIVVRPAGIGRLPDGLRDSWRDLLDKAVRHAAEWQGFGAKTSAGYGRGRVLRGPDGQGAEGGAAPSPPAEDEWTARVRKARAYDEWRNLCSEAEKHYGDGHVARAGFAKAALERFEELRKQKMTRRKQGKARQKQRDLVARLQEWAKA